MKFTIFERIVLFGLLAKVEGNYLNLKYLRKFKEDLTIGLEEREDINLRNDQTGTHWDKESDKDIKVPFPVLEIIKQNLVKLNKIEKLNEELIPLYERFVENFEDADKERILDFKEDKNE
jgi:hypothetical protein